MISLDTEDDSNGNVTIIDFYDGNKHTTFANATPENLRHAAWDHLHKIAPERVWACNMEYDLINLFGGKWLGKLCTLQYVKPGLMRGVFREARISFYDTLRHWAISVKGMGEFVNLPKMEKDFTSVEYCQRDAEVVWLFVNRLLQVYKHMGLSLRCTLPGMAIQLFKHRFYPHEFIPIPESIRQIMKKGYYGGRVEVYRQGDINETINHYDINSLFPSVMVDNLYPSPNSWKTVTEPNFDNEGIFVGTVSIPYSNIPGLPFRSGLDLLYCYGDIEGSWPYPEIRQLLKDGGKITQCKMAVEFADKENPFKEYIKYCYQKRLQSTNALDNTFWKLMMNSLYGKFGQDSPLEIIFNDKSSKLKTKAKHSNIIWSAYVTSYARLRLLGFLRSHEPFYTDTDSLFTADVLPTSTRLGDMKHEGTYQKATFVTNKIYTLDDSVFKAKGVPKGDNDEIVKGFITTGKAIYRKPARFRESRRTSKDANVWYDQSKELRTEYRKRRVNEDGTTEPWEIEDYRREYQIN